MADRAHLIGGGQTKTNTFGLDTMTAREKAARDFIQRKAMEAIYAEVPKHMWLKLSSADKAIICTKVMRALLDPQRIAALLNGERKRLI